MCGHIYIGSGILSNLYANAHKWRVNVFNENGLMVNYSNLLNFSHVEVVKGCEKCLRFCAYIKKESGCIEKDCAKLKKYIDLFGKLHE